MKKALVIAEKPSVGKDIAKVLGCQSRGKSHAENNAYIVTWAFGHLVTLADPEKYGKSFGEWNFENMPVIPDPFKLSMIPKTKGQFLAIKKMIHRQDVDHIIIATDAGREGELVARWILDLAGNKKPIKRLWISSVTDRAIKDGFSKLRRGEQYDNLYHAAVARAKADWIVGLNGTRSLMVKHQASLSLGRVQTPTLQLVRDREEQIMNFKPKTYWQVNAMMGDFNMLLRDEKGGTRFFQEEQVKTIEDISKKAKQAGQAAVIESVQVKNKTEYPQALYDLTQLQRDANRLFQFSAKETLSIMQTLYERHKVLTYPRTDSRYLTSDIVETLAERIEALPRQKYKEDIALVKRSKIQGNKSFVNDAKVGDHHAIIPTEQSPNLIDFSSKEMKIYDLVVKRFLSVLAPPLKYQEIQMTVKLDGLVFGGNLRVEENQAKSKTYNKGDKIPFGGLRIKREKTAPPNYLTEGDLLAAMEKNGLGTVATRAEMIEKILSNHYVEMVGQHIRTTATGRQLLELVPDKLRSPALTSTWEKDLVAIEKGQLKSDVFMNKMNQMAKEVVKSIKMDTRTFRHDNLSTESCPECGERLLEIKNKYGKKLVCKNPDCHYKRNLSKMTNHRCPNCHKKMELVGDKENQTFVCSCGYKEKMETFEKKKRQQNKTMSKREAQRYLKKNEKNDEPFNNPFADLLQEKFQKK